MSLDFEVGGHQYRAERLSAIKQLHLSRRIGPLLPPLAPLFVQVARASANGNVMGNLDALAPLAQPFMDSLASMSDADVEYVIALSLSTVKRRTGDTWASVWNEKANLPMFTDLNDIGTLMPIVAQVIKENLGPFIAGILTDPQHQETPAP